uniref:S-adenosylmethionine-dependent methyltransferase n=1 Tax=Davidia involucrata TaxID=16924 RepID=A0A5B7AEZ5_DAVIN
MSNNDSASVPESFPMNGGDGTYSYTKNSHFQRAALNFVKEMINEAIAENLEIELLTSTSNTLRIADLGCSVGPNTFIAMENVLQAIETKYQNQCLTSKMPEFQVFFNDHSANDFNTLFTSLPPDRRYFAAGVPGSFYSRLFPESSLHFVHSSYALQWFSKVPEELLDKNSPAWNKGRIHYRSASNEVANAYAAQFEKDMKVFLDARAEEIVVGGMMVLIIPALPDELHQSQLPAGLLFDFLGSSLMDMVNEGLINEAQVDSFNLPVYAATPKEMALQVERNGCFSIERMKLTNPRSKIDGPFDAQKLIMHLRAGMEGIFTKHFGHEIVAEMFERTLQRSAELSHQLESLESSYMKGTQLFLVLKRK